MRSRRWWRSGSPDATSERDGRVAGASVLATEVVKPLAAGDQEGADSTEGEARLAFLARVPDVLNVNGQRCSQSEQKDEGGAAMETPPPTLGRVGTGQVKDDVHHAVTGVPSECSSMICATALKCLRTGFAACRASRTTLVRASATAQAGFWTETESLPW